jgi:hypothetical protein
VGMRGTPRSARREGLGSPWVSRTRTWMILILPPATPGYADGVATQIIHQLPQLSAGLTGPRNQGSTRLAGMARDGTCPAPDCPTSRLNAPAS